MSTVLRQRQVDLFMCWPCVAHCKVYTESALMHRWKNAVIMCVTVVLLVKYIYLRYQCYLHFVVVWNHSQCTAAHTLCP